LVAMYLAETLPRYFCNIGSRFKLQLSDYEISEIRGTKMAYRVFLSHGETDKQC